MTLPSIERTKAETGDLDTCVCGDYRRDHIDGTGRCKMNGLGHMVPGYSCEKFELSEVSKSERS